VIGAVVLIAYLPPTIQKLRYADFVLSGTVVDQDGKPLDEVGVQVTAGRRVKIGFDSEYRQRTATVSGQFSLLERKCSTVTLFFHKPGFRGEVLHFTTSGKHSGICVTLARGTGTSYPSALPPSSAHPAVR
jgi:hypothetical protein